MSKGGIEAASVLGDLKMTDDSREDVIPIETSGTRLIKKGQGQSLALLGCHNYRMVTLREAVTGEPLQVPLSRTTLEIVTEIAIS